MKMTDNRTRLQTCAVCPSWRTAIMIMMSRRLPAICVVFAAAAAGFGVHPLPSGDKSHRVAITLRVLGSPDDFSAGRKHHLRIEFAKLLEMAPQDVSAHAHMEPAGTGTGTGPAAIVYPDDYNQEGRRLDACPGPTCASYKIEIVGKGAGLPPPPPPLTQRREPSPTHQRTRPLLRFNLFGRPREAAVGERSTIHPIKGRQRRGSGGVW